MKTINIRNISLSLCLGLFSFHTYIVNTAQNTNLQADSFPTTHRGLASKEIKCRIPKGKNGKQMKLVDFKNENYKANGCEYLIEITIDDEDFAQLQILINNNGIPSKHPANAPLKVEESPTFTKVEDAFDSEIVRKFARKVYDSKINNLAFKRIKRGSISTSNHPAERENSSKPTKAIDETTTNNTTAGNHPAEKKQTVKPLAEKKETARKAPKAKSAPKKDVAKTPDTKNTVKTTTTKTVTTPKKNTKKVVATKPVKKQEKIVTAPVAVKNGTVEDTATEAVQNKIKEESSKVATSDADISDIKDIFRNLKQADASNKACLLSAESGDRLKNLLKKHNAIIKKHKVDFKYNDDKISTLDEKENKQIKALYTDLNKIDLEESYNTDLNKDCVKTEVATEETKKEKIDTDAAAQVEADKVLKKYGIIARAVKGSDQHQQQIAVINESRASFNLLKDRFAAKGAHARKLIIRRAGLSAQKRGARVIFTPTVTPRTLR